MIFYLDAGNPTSPQRVYNPHFHHVPPESVIKVASNPKELVWDWGSSLTNIRKFWYDMQDNWMSVMDVVQHVSGSEMYQKPGSFNIPDMLSIGLGALSEAEYRSQMFLFSGAV